MNMASSDLREIEKFKKEKRKAEQKGELAKVAELCNVIGDLYSKTGHHEDAIEEHQMELQLCEALAQDLDVGVAHRKIGECHMHLGDFEKALRHQRDYLRIAEDCDSVVEQQRAQATIGHAFLQQADALSDSSSSSSVKQLLRQAREAFESSLQLSERLHQNGDISSREYAEMKARLLLNLGGVFDNNGDLDRCTECMKQGIALAERHSLAMELYMLQASLAAIYERQGEVDLAVKHYDLAIRQSQLTRNKDDEASCHMYKAKLLAQQGKFPPAKRMVKIAYKIQSTPATKATIAMVFKLIIKLCILSSKLQAVEQDDYESKVKLYEKLGDTAASLSHFKQALKYYHLMLRCAEAVGQSGAALIPAYVSLSQTYLDDKQYSQALTYLRKELRCRQGDLEQECRTYLNIASAQEKARLPYEQIRDSYVAALDCAKRAKHRRLQLRGLDLLAQCQENSGLMELRQQTVLQIERLRDKYQLTDSDLEEEEEEGAEEDKEEEEDIDLDDLVLSDESDEEFDHAAQVPGRARRTKAAQFKKNEKGETPLHVAAIHGDVKKVKLLLSQGHPLNERDYTGWLPLHEACNHGFLEIVSLLLAAGANINDRGGAQCGGVTPLHDACNCGNLEVIGLLVEKGANVHAKDDEGQTPLDCLLDFRQRSDLGRQDVSDIKAVERLLRATMGGENPHLAQGHPRPVHAEQFDTELDDLPDLAAPSARQRRNPGRRNLVLDSQDSDSQSVTGDTEDIVREYENDSEDIVDCSQSPRTVRVRHASSDEDEDDNGSIYRSSILPQMEPVTGAGDYRLAMEAMRHGTAVKPGQSFQPVKKAAASKSALVMDSTYVGDHDDWLEDDLGATNQRKRPAANSVFTTSGTRRTKADDVPAREKHRRSRDPSDDDSSSHQRKRRSRSGEHGVDDDPSPDHQRKRRRELSPSDMDMPADGDYEYSDVDVAFFSENSNEAFTSDFRQIQDLDTRHTSSHNRSRQPKKRQVTLTSMGLGRTVQPSRQPRAIMGASGNQTVSGTLGGIGNQTVSVSETEPPQSSGKLPSLLMRLRVRVNERCMLVPVTESPEPRTIGWLAEQAADRYYSICHMRPVLSLTTQDGALLAPDDLIMTILTNNEEVLGVVESWSLTPMPERYVEACKAFKTIAYKNVRAILHTVATSNSMTLNDLCLRPAHFLPITRALQGQSSLKELSLKGNLIGDAGIESLCKVLPSLVNLRRLDLSSCQLTMLSLKHMVALAEPKANSAQPLQVLECLLLNFNPLGDTCTAQMAMLLRHLPGLTSLGLQACGISLKFFQQHRMQLMEAIQAGSLEHMDLSRNTLSSTGVELLLKCVKPSALLTFDLTACVSSYAINHMAKHLLRYVQQSSVVLQKLVLDCCCLTQDHMLDLASLVNQCSSLESLSLSGNTKLGCQDISSVLEAAARTSSSRLRCLSFCGCALRGALQVSFIDAVSDKLNHEHPLCELAFTCEKMSDVDVASLKEVWSNRWADEGVCTLDAPKLVLSVKL